MEPQLHELIGHPEKDLARMQATSPALHADKIKTPLFIAQGANDPRVNKAESDQMVEALKKSAASTCSTWSKITKATVSTTKKTASSSTRPLSASSTSTSTRLVESSRE